MTVTEPWAVGDELTNVAHHDTTAAVLNADIENLTAFKDTAEPVPVKAVFKPVIGILTLVRVRSLTPFPLPHLLTDDTTRTR